MKSRASSADPNGAACTAGPYDWGNTSLGGILKRSSVIVSAAIGLALVGGGVMAAKTVRDNITAQQACSAIQAEKAAGLVHAGEGKEPVVILGDSYAASEYLDQRTDGWAYKLAAAERWGALVAGIGGTGFVNQGPCGTDVFANRMPKALAAKPNVLVIQGGLNDFKATPQDTEMAARMLLDQAKTVKKIIVVGPANAPARAETLPEIDAALKRAAESKGAKYVSALGWDLEFQADRLHLTPAGHTKFATKVAESLAG